MSSNSWILDETTLPRIGFLGQGNHGYVSLVKTPDGLLMAKKTSLAKYSENLEKELRILHHFNSINFNIIRPTSPILYEETKPFDNKIYSIYMEVAPHGSLKDMVDGSNSRIPENVIGYCTLPILEGLKDLHNEGYIHCDIKPENILIFPSYTHGELCELKIADFGLAKEPNKPNPEPEYSSEYNRYAAPETIENNGRLTGILSSAVDIWSLGIMVSGMLGCIMLGGRNRNFLSMFSPIASDFVRRCTEPDPAARATAEELLSHPFVRQSLGDPPLELLPVPSCLRGGLVQGRFF